MSFSKSVKHIAPPVIGKMDLLGISNKLILVEAEDSFRAIHPCIKDETNIIFCHNSDDVIYEGMQDSAIVTVESIYRVYDIVKKLNSEVDNYIIHKIDWLDLELSKRVRGSQVKAYLSMLSSPKILRGANLIVTSCQTEYTVRDIADVFFNLK